MCWMRCGQQCARRPSFETWMFTTSCCFLARRSHRLVVRFRGASAFAFLAREVALACMHDLLVSFLRVVGALLPFRWLTSSPWRGGSCFCCSGSSTRPRYRQEHASYWLTMTPSSCLRAASSEHNIEKAEASCVALGTRVQASMCKQKHITGELGILPPVASGLCSERLPAYRIVGRVRQYIVGRTRWDGALCVRCLPYLRWLHPGSDPGGYYHVLTVHELEQPRRTCSCAPAGQVEVLVVVRCLVPQARVAGASAKNSQLPIVSDWGSRSQIIDFYTAAAEGGGQAAVVKRQRGLFCSPC